MSDETLLWRRVGPVFLSDVVPPAMCTALVEELHERTPVPRTYQGLVDDSYRRADFVVASEATTAQVAGLLLPYVGRAFPVDVEYSSTNPMAIYRYPVGVGFKVHHDEVTDTERERAVTGNSTVIGGDITAVIAIGSDSDYKGGRLVFPKHGVSARPQRGSVVMFPATRDFPHKVSPITAGIRYTAVMRFDVVKRRRRGARVRV